MAWSRLHGDKPPLLVADRLWPLHHSPPAPPTRPLPQLRCYRLGWFFSFLTYSLATPLLLVTLLRNVLLTFYIANFEACLFYYLARQGGFSEDTWVQALGAGERQPLAGRGCAGGHAHAAACEMLQRLRRARAAFAQCVTAVQMQALRLHLLPCRLVCWHIHGGAVHLVSGAGLPRCLLCCLPGWFGTGAKMWMLVAAACAPPLAHTDTPGPCQPHALPTSTAPFTLQPSLWPLWATGTSMPTALWRPGLWW